jgi:membrane protein YdbS with pleckstrin-like domain
MSAIAGYGSIPSRSSVRHSRTSRSRSGATDGIDSLRVSARSRSRRNEMLWNVPASIGLADVESPQTASQLAGSVAGEGERHHVTRLGVAAFESMGDAPGQHRRLARTRGSDDRRGGRPCSPPPAAGRRRVRSAGDRRSWRHDTTGVRDSCRPPPRVHFGTVASMPFPKKNLNANETIALDMHPHWWYFAEPALTLLGAIILAGLVLGETDGDTQKSLGWVMLIILVGTAIWLVVRYLKWLTTNFVITSNRLIFRQGLIAKSGIEIPLERVNNVNFHQSVFERILGAGDLLIESGGEDGQQRFTDIRHPAQVQNLIHAQMEGHFQRRASYAAPPPPPPGGDVTQQLERLEGMLQRGTLTQEEFNAQKAKLLG